MAGVVAVHQGPHEPQNPEPLSSPDPRAQSLGEEADNPKSVRFRPATIPRPALAAAACEWEAAGHTAGCYARYDFATDTLRWVCLNPDGTHK